MDKFIEIALIKRPQGVKGELRLLVLLDDNKNLQNFSEVFVEGSEMPFKVHEIKKVADDYAIKLDGIDSYEDAEKLKNKKLLAKREDVDKFKSTKDFYMADIIGKTAYLSTGEFVGIVDDIENYGASDVVFIRSQKYTNLSFANVGGIILSVDQEKQEVILDADEFSKYCVYDEQDEN